MSTFWNLARPTLPPSGSLSWIALAAVVWCGGTGGLTAADSAPTVAAPALATPAETAAKSVKLSVRGADDGGEPALTYTWASTGPAAVTFSANGTNAAKACTATFRAIGDYALNATIADTAGQTVVSSIPVRVTATLSSIAMSPTSAVVNPGLTKAFVLTAKDQFGIALAAQPTVAWTIAGNGTIDAAGLFTAGDAGSATVAATAGGKTATAAVRVNAAPTVAIPAATDASSISGKTAEFTVQGADDTSIDLLIYAWTATGPKTVSFSPSRSTTGEHTLATFAAAGSYVLTATISDREGLSAVSTVSVEVLPIPTAVVIAPAIGTILNPGATKSFAATVQDQFKASIATHPDVAWAVTSGSGIIEAAGLFTAGATPGPVSLTATCGAATATATLTVNAPPTVATPVATAAPSIAGKTAVFTVLGADDAGEPALTYTWTATGPRAVGFAPSRTNAAKQTTATFAAIGTYTVTATITDKQGLTVASATTVEVTAVPSAVTVAPASQVVNPGLTKAFTAAVYDQFKAKMATPPAVTWAVASGDGTIDAAGLFTAGTTPGPVSLTAACADVSGSVALRVNAAPTVSSPVATATPVITGTTAEFTVQGADDDNVDLLIYSWTATGPRGVVFAPRRSVDGEHATATFAAVGTYTVTATITDKQGLKATSIISVEVQPTVAGIGVTPTPITLNPGTKRAFVAGLRDQFNAAMAGAVTVTWSASAGTIDAAGLFTAPTAPGDLTITAAASTPAASATASVHINTGPAVATPATATSPTAAATIPLTVLGGDDSSEASLKYTWTVAKGAPGAVSFGGATQATNAAKAITATVSAPGTYTFVATIRDASGLTTTSSVPVEVQFPAPAITPAGGTFSAIQTLTLTKAQPDGEIRYTLDGSDPTASSTEFTAPLPLGHPATVITRVFRAGWAPSPAAQAVIAYQTQAVVASLAAGSYVGPQQVTLTCPTADAVIAYTLDGTTPTATSPVTAGPIALPGSCTLTAVATVPGWTVSAPASWAYTLRCADPVWTVAPGMVPSGTVVSAATTTTDGSIHVTIDGSEPTAASPVLPLTLTASQTLRCRTFKPGWEPSAVVEGVYTVNDRTPTVTFTVPRVEQGIFSAGSMTVRVVTDGPTTQDIQVPVSLTGAMRDTWAAFLMDPWWGWGYSQDITLTLPASPSAPASADVLVYVESYYLTAAGITGRLEMGTPTNATQGSLTQVDLVILPNLAPAIAGVTADPSPLNGGTTARLTATVTDDGGSDGLDCTWTLISGPSGVSFSANGGPGAVVTDVSFAQVGHYEIRCDVQDGYGYWWGPRQSASAQMAVDVLPKFQLSLDKSVVNPGGTLTARHTDQFGTTSGSAVQWESSVGTITAEGVFTAPAEPGSVILRAVPTAGGEALTAAVRINATPLIVKVEADPATVTSSTTILRLTVADDDALTSVLAVWSLPETAPNARLAFNGGSVQLAVPVTFSRAGQYPFAVQVTDPQGLSATAAITVAVQTMPTTVVVSPSNAVVQAGATAAYTATVRDQFAQEMPGVPVAWSSTAGAVVGTSTDALLTAGSGSGRFLVVAGAGAATGSATIRVNTAPVITALAPASDPVTGVETVITAVIEDDLPAAATTLVWSVIAGPEGAALSPRSDGRSVAMTALCQGAYCVRTVATDGDGAVMARECLVTIAARPLAILLSATPIAGDPPGQIQFTAAVTDQFGAIVESPAMTWTVTGPGTISEQGVWTPPPSDGSGGSASAGGTDGGAGTPVGSSGAAIVSVSIAGSTLTASAAVPGTGGPGGDGGGADPTPPTAAAMTVTAGLTGVQRGLMDGAPASFTKESTVMLRLVPVSTSPVLRVDVVGATGTSSATDPGAITLNDLPEGILHLGAVVTVGTATASATASFSDLLTLVVDRTPPVVARTVIADKELALGAQVRLNSNSKDRCSYFRSLGLYCFPADTHEEDITVTDDGSGLAPQVPKVAVRKATDTGSGTPVGGSKWVAGSVGRDPVTERTIRATAWGNIPDTVAYQGFAIAPGSSTASVLVPVRDRCGNEDIKNAHAVTIKKVLPRGRVAALPYQEIGPVTDISVDLLVEGDNRYEWCSSTALLRCSADVWRLDGAKRFAGIVRDEGGGLLSPVWVVPANSNLIKAVDGHGNDVGWSLCPESQLREEGFPEWKTVISKEFFGISLDHRIVHIGNSYPLDYAGNTSSGQYTGVCGIVSALTPIGPVASLTALPFQPIDDVEICISGVPVVSEINLGQQQLEDNVGYGNASLVSESSSNVSEGAGINEKAVVIPLVTGRLLSGSRAEGGLPQVFDWRPGRGVDTGPYLPPGTWSDANLRGELHESGPMRLFPLYSGSGVLEYDAEYPVYSGGDARRRDTSITRWTVTPNNADSDDLSASIKETYWSNWGGAYEAVLPVMGRIWASRQDESGWPKTHQGHATWVVGNPGVVPREDILLAPAANNITEKSQRLRWRSQWAGSASRAEVLPDGFGIGVPCDIDGEGDVALFSAILESGAYRCVWERAARFEYRIPKEEVLGQRIGDISASYFAELPYDGSTTTIARSSSYNRDEQIFQAEESLVSVDCGVEKQVCGFEAVRVLGIERGVVLAGVTGNICLRGGVAKLVGVIDPDTKSNVMGVGDSMVRLVASEQRGDWEDPQLLTNPQLTITLEVGPKVKPKLYHIDLDLGADPANAEQLDGLGLKIRSGVYRVKDALSVWKPDIVPTVPKYAECLRKRSGKADEPVIIMTSGGDKRVNGCSLAGTVEEDKNVWEFTAKYDSPAFAGDTGTYAVVWDVGGGQVTSGTVGGGLGGGSASVTVKYSAGQYKPSLKVYRKWTEKDSDGKEVQKGPALVGTAAIHTINVYSKYVDGTAWTVTPVAEDDRYGSETKLERKTDEGVGINVHVGVDVNAQGACRARISPDGYPQNEYWVTAGDSGDLPQPYAFKPESTTRGWTQGYGDPSPSTDNLSVRVKVSKSYEDDVTSAKFTTVLLEGGVDNNRDKTIAFDENDRTSMVNPCRFWINEDRDEVVLQSQPGASPAFYNEEDDTVGSPDSSDNYIPCPRDLEDFMRVHLRWKEPNVSESGLSVATIEVRWRPRGDGQGGMGLNLAAESDGGIKYLQEWESGGAADGQSLPNGARSFALRAALAASAWQTIKVPESGGSSSLRDILGAYKTGRPQGLMPFIAEGVAKGIGRLEFRVRLNGESVAHAGVWIDLVSVSSLFERWSCGYSEESMPAPAAAIGLGRVYDEDRRDGTSTIIHIHGWNMTDQPGGKQDRLWFAATMYKRLWWQGYKGRLISFEWPTNDSKWSFDESEFFAWLTGPRLATVIIDTSARFSGQPVYVTAHSQGNVVAGEALRELAAQGRGSIVSKYIAMQAAIPKNVWDGEVTDMGEGNPTAYAGKVDAYRGWVNGVVGTAIAAIKPGGASSIGNPVDYAMTGLGWGGCQSTKPDGANAPTAVFGMWNYHMRSRMTNNTPIPDGSRIYREYGIMGKENVVLPWNLMAPPELAYYTDMSFVLLMGESNPVLNGATPSAYPHVARYEAMSFCTPGRWPPLGCVATGAGPVGFASVDGTADPGCWRDLATDPQEFREHRWHSAQFRMNIAKQYLYWKGMYNAVK